MHLPKITETESDQALRANYQFIKKKNLNNIRIYQQNLDKRNSTGKKQIQRKKRDGKVTSIFKMT